MLSLDNFYSSSIEYFFNDSLSDDDKIVKKQEIFSANSITKKKRFKNHKKPTLIIRFDSVYVFINCNFIINIPNL